MLELEIQGKVQLGKVNQELQCQIITLEAEIEKMKAQLGIIPEDQVSAIVRRNSRAFKDIRKSRSGLYRSSSGIKKSKSGVGDKGPAQPDLEEDALEEVSELEEEINALKGLVQIARASADDWEAKFKEASQKLLLAQGKKFSNFGNFLVECEISLKFLTKLTVIGIIYVHTQQILPI